MIQFSRKEFMRNLRAYPMQAIEQLLAYCLVIFGIYNMIPSEWLGVATVYPAYAGKLIGGLSMLIPAAILIGVRLKGLGYYLLNLKLRKIFMMWLLIDYLYIAVLRATLVSLFPPIFVLYIILGSIAGVCYLKLGMDEE